MIHTGHNDMESGHFHALQLVTGVRRPTAMGQEHGRATIILERFSVQDPKRELRHQRIVHSCESKIDMDKPRNLTLACRAILIKRIYGPH
jgi:hypothetical protein